MHNDTEGEHVEGGSAKEPNEEEDEHIDNNEAGLASSPQSVEPTESSPDMRRQQSMTPEAHRGDSSCFATAEFALFNVSSPRRLGESLRSAASSHFPEAVDRIVRESSQRSQSQRRAAAALEAEDDKSDTTPSEQLSSKSGAAEPPSSSAFLRGGAAEGACGGHAGGMSTDSFATESFASTQHNSSVVFSSTVPSSTQLDGAATVPVRKKSFFAALLESKASTVSHQSVGPQMAATTSSGVDAPRKAYRCKATFLGDSGSGKTTFQKCVSQSMLRTLPDAAPSTSSSSTMYYYRSETKREKLDLQVVDAGPFPLSCALTHMYEQTNLFILVMSLAGVKQRTGKKFLSFGNEPSAIVHAQDKGMIRAYIASVCASMPLASTTGAPAHRAPMLVVVGTHKDLLTDQSREAVETVLRELNRVVGHAMRAMEQPPQLLGCFAVACSDHSCVPENRGGPKSIPELWSFLCDICLKEAAQTRALLGEAPIKYEDIHRRIAFQSPLQQGQPAAVPLSSPVVAATGPAHAPVASDVSAITERVVTFIRRAKTELNFVIVHMRALRQVAFSLGLYSQAHLDAILQMLSRDGEIMLLDRQPKHVGGREDSVVLWPHLAHRAVVTLTKYQRSNCYPPSERAALLPGVDVEECNKGDPTRSAITSAVFAPALLVALSKTLPQTRRPVVERAETFALLLLLVDFVFQRKRLRGAAAKRHQPAGAATGIDTSIDSNVALNKAELKPTQHQERWIDSAAEPLLSPRARANTVEPSPSARGGEAQNGPRCASSLSSTRHRQPSQSASTMWGVEYIAPGLLNASIPSETATFFDETLLKAPINGGVLMGAYAATVVSRVLCIPCCPPEVFHRMVCRWGPFVVPQTTVYRDAVWLRRVHLTDDDGGGQGFSDPHHHRPLDDDSDDSEEAMDGGSAAGDAWGGEARGRGRRHTRCFARAVWHEESNDLEVRLTVLSTEELLATAHFTNTLLRVACHMLDCRYPGLAWSVQERARDAVGSGQTEVVDIAHVAELDAKFR